MMRLLLFVLRRMAICLIVTNGLFIHGQSNLAYAQAPSTLWQIGTIDQDDKEFALAPKSWGNYTKDATYVIGTSTPDVDWPYVQPGPDDQWAGSKPHTNSIYFGLANAVTQGSCNLSLYLIDTQQPYAPELSVSVNGKSWDEQTGPGSGDSSLNGAPELGKHTTISIDFPASLLRAGVNVVTITSNQGSWIVYDAVVMTTPPVLQLTKLPTFAAIQSANWLHDVLALRQGQYQQVLKISTVNTGNAGMFDLFVSGEGTQAVFVPAGDSSQQLYFPESSGYQMTTLSLRSPGVASNTVTAERARCKRYTIYEIEHSHMDIGYAYLQQKTLDIHRQDIDDSFKQFAKTSSFPSDSKFRWNCESLVETEAWLKQASPARIAQFKTAVKDGDLGLAALYDNELTGLCRPEELAALLADANELRLKYGIPIDSAMISDVPGYTWGIVPMLADSGIKYFSWGPNPSDHLGSARDFDNQAFYWLSPSGKEKTLVWQTNNGYQPAFGASQDSLVGYLTQFDIRFPNDPYRMICDRHTINDNGPIDPDLPVFVKGWNSEYAYPHIVMSTNSRMFHDFEKKYGATLPVIHGDYTGYWEDGAASSAAETSLNRNGAELLAQDEVLWSAIDPANYPSAAIADAWKSSVLYDEHTWGSYDSWSDPETDFTKQQWAWKRQYAVDTVSKSERLLRSALSKLPSSQGSKAVAVFNTSNWKRSDLVTVPADESAVGDIVRDTNGKVVPSQRLTDGSLAFLATNLPPLSSRKFVISTGKATTSGQAAASDDKLKTSTMSLSFDPVTGSINGWQVEGVGHDLVDHSNLTCHGLNDYLYVLGDNNSNVSSVSMSKVTVVESGPLVATIRIDSVAPGCRSLSRTYRVVDGLNYVWMSDSLDKEIAHQNEAVQIGFNFLVPDDVVRMDMPWSVVRPDIDQTEHANKTVYPVDRWVDVSNSKLGITCANLDTPMMEIGQITSPRENEGGWLDSAMSGSAIYWNAMNNYWHTNYKAYQPGPATFRYAMYAHGSFDQTAAQQFGTDRSQPLIVVPIDRTAPDYSLSVQIDNPSIMLTACQAESRGKSFLVRLFNGSDVAQKCDLQWRGQPNCTVQKTDLWGNSGVVSSSSLKLMPMEIVTVRVSK